MTDPNLEIETMPRSRKEFELNMFLLSEAIANDKVKINRSNVRTIKGIQNTRLTPNNRANLRSVDEMARLMSNMIAQVSLREEI